MTQRKSDRLELLEPRRRTFETRTSCDDDDTAAQIGEVKSPGEHRSTEEDSDECGAPMKVQCLWSSEHQDTINLVKANPPPACMNSLRDYCKTSRDFLGQE